MVPTLELDPWQMTLERRALERRLRQEGQTLRAIAKAVGVSHEQVRNDLKEPKKVSGGYSAVIAAKLTPDQLCLLSTMAARERTTLSAIVRKLIDTAAQRDLQPAAVEEGLGVVT